MHVEKIPLLLLSTILELVPLSQGYLDLKQGLTLVPEHGLSGNDGNIHGHHGWPVARDFLLLEVPHRTDRHETLGITLFKKSYLKYVNPIIRVH